MTLADDVYRQIRADILACRIAPGTKLRINEFCERFGVSLGAVREALSKLSADGLVVAEAQKGYQVAPVSRDELVDLTQTRIEIECLCLRDAIATGDLEWESRIVASFHRLTRIDEHDKTDTARLSDAWIVAHSEFHSALVSACRSEVKLRIRHALYEQTERYRRLSVPVRGKAKRDVNGEHRALMSAALKRNTELACSLMAKHLGKTADILLSASFLDTSVPAASRKNSR